MWRWVTLAILICGTAVERSESGTHWACMASLLSADNANSVYMKTQANRCAQSLILSYLQHTFTLYSICMRFAHVQYVMQPMWVTPLHQCLCPWCVSPLAVHFISVWIVTVFPPLLFIELSHLLTFTSSFNNKTSKKYLFHRRGPGGREKQEGETSAVGSMVQKIVFIECCVAHISCRHR